MNVVSMKEYLEFQYKFLREHVVENVYTTKMIDNSYSKHYICEDNSELWECNEVVTEQVEVEVHKVKMTIPVRMIRHEMWTNEHASVYAYEELRYGGVR